MELIGTAVGFILGISSSLLTERINRWIKRPGIAISFQADENCLREANSEINDGIRVFHEELKYVRLKVHNSRRNPGKACRCFVTAIRRSSKVGIKTIFADTLPLRWAYLGFNPIDIPAGTTFYADILSTREKANYFTMEMNPMPLNFNHATKERARYEIDIAVVGDNFDPVTLTLIIDWKQNWNDLDVWTHAS